MASPVTTWAAPTIVEVGGQGAVTRCRPWKGPLLVGEPDAAAASGRGGQHATARPAAVRPSGPILTLRQIRTSWRDHDPRPLPAHRPGRHRHRCRARHRRRHRGGAGRGRGRRGDLGAHGRSSSPEVAAQVEAAGRRALVVPADLSDLDAVAGLAQAAVDAFGRLDVVVDNLGGSMPRPFEHTSPRYLAEAFNFNVVTAHALNRAALPIMLENGGGSIVGISSIMGRVAGRGYLAYGTAKAGLAHYTRLAARDLVAAHPGERHRRGVGGHLGARHRPGRRRHAHHHGGGHAAAPSASPTTSPPPCCTWPRRRAATSPARSSRSTGGSSSPTSTSASPTSDRAEPWHRRSA